MAKDTGLSEDGTPIAGLWNRFSGRSLEMEYVDLKNKLLEAFGNQKKVERGYFWEGPAFGRWIKVDVGFDYDATEDNHNFIIVKIYDIDDHGATGKIGAYIINRPTEIEATLDEICMKYQI